MIKRSGIVVTLHHHIVKLRERLQRFNKKLANKVSLDVESLAPGGGIYSGLRAEDTKLCALVIIGVNERGQKQFLVIEDGIRESTQSWREVLLDLKARGMNATQLAVGDGALGFWAALDEVYSETRHQRCWVHKTANVLNTLPKSVQPKVKQALYSICRQRRDTVQKPLLNSLRWCMSRNIPRRFAACKKTEKRYWRSTTFRHSTGRVCEQPIRLNRALRAFDIERNDQRDA